MLGDPTQRIADEGLRDYIFRLQYLVKHYRQVELKYQARWFFYGIATGVLGAFLMGILLMR